MVYCYYFHCKIVKSVRFLDNLDKIGYEGIGTGTGEDHPHGYTVTDHQQYQNISSSGTKGNK